MTLKRGSTTIEPEPTTLHWADSWNRTDPRGESVFDWIGEHIFEPIGDFFQDIFEDPYENEKTPVKNPGEVREGSQTQTKTQEQEEFLVFYHYGFRSESLSFAGGIWPGGYASPQGPGEFYYDPLVIQDRLALPDPMPPDAYYIVSIDPEEAPILGPSIVQKTRNPKRNGGGWEVRFPAGTPPGSVEGPFNI
ncbi:MAG: hypothetical protein HYS08_01825 [Chlamydiae bacterium]|nr:hypothetical protein [Chlamydiota bacterium]